MVFTFFYNSNPITTFFLCSIFRYSDPETRILKPVLTCHRTLFASLFYVIGHIANKYSDIFSILKELIIFPEKGDLFRIGKTNTTTLRPKFVFFPS